MENATDLINAVGVRKSLKEISAWVNRQFNTTIGADAPSWADFLLQLSCQETAVEWWWQIIHHDDLENALKPIREYVDMYKLIERQLSKRYGAYAEENDAELSRDLLEAASRYCEYTKTETAPAIHFEMFEQEYRRIHERHNMNIAAAKLLYKRGCQTAIECIARSIEQKEKSDQEQEKATS